MMKAYDEKMVMEAVLLNDTATKLEELVVVLNHLDECLTERHGIALCDKKKDIAKILGSKEAAYRIYNALKIRQKELMSEGREI